jgi:hypothetical protein
MREHLLHAQTPEGVAFRENGLRNLEQALLAKTDWQTSQERDEAIAQFRELAQALRAIDAQVLVKLN